MSEKDEEIVKEEAAEETEAAAEETPAAEVADPKDEEIAKLKDQLMRNMAEYDNYRKRTAKEKTEKMLDITARVVTELLLVLDNLELSLVSDCTEKK